MNGSLSARLQKLVRKLHSKKYRDRTGLFLVERLKNIDAYMQAGWTPEFFVTLHPETFPYAGAAPVYEVSREVLSRIGTLKNPYDMLAVFRKRPPCHRCPLRGLIPILDNVQDPGNLGTVMRTADWFGITCIYATPGSVDAYHPKTVQAAMGAQARVRVCHRAVDDFRTPDDIPLWAASMEGENLFTASLPRNFFLLFGNEGHGYSPEWKSLLRRTVRIPAAPGKVSESLNLSVSAAVCMAEWFRRYGKHGGNGSF